MTVAVASALYLRPSDGFTGWEGLVALLRRAFDCVEGRIDPSSSLHRLDAAGLAARAQVERYFLVASAHGRQAGCVCCEPRPGCLYIGKLAVEPMLQRRGIGRLLIARALGLPGLELQTRIELVENHAAFARMGFARVAETAHPGLDRPRSITMRKDLQ